MRSAVAIWSMPVARSLRSSVRALAAAAASRASPARCPASPRPPRSPSSRRAPRPTEARGRPTDDPDPNRNAYTVPGGAAVARLRRQLLRPLGRRGHRRAQPHRHQRRRHPRLRRTGARGRRTRPRDRERQARLARAASPTARIGGGNGKTDIYLAEIGGELFGYAAPDRGQAVARPPDSAPPARLPGPRQRLQRLRVPGHDAGPRPRGDARPRVQPHPPVRLRRLPGPLVRRVDRGLDGGPGLQRRSTTTCATCAAGCTAWKRR